MKPHFSPRQHEIMSLAAQGLASKKIALVLGVSPRTVETHLERLYRSNGFPNRSAAIASWLQIGKKES